MRRVIYNKLVRDNIPKIIKDQGKKAKTRILSDEDYKKQLQRKLVEETNEFIANGDVTELADIVEVVRAILVFEGVGFDEFEAIRQNKASRNGRFNNKILLEEVISDKEI